MSCKKAAVLHLFWFLWIANSRLQIGDLNVGYSGDLNTGTRLDVLWGQPIKFLLQNFMNSDFMNSDETTLISSFFCTLSFLQGLRRTLYFLLFLFSYALILFFFENGRFSFVFPSVLITFCFKRKLKLFHKMAKSDNFHSS